MHQELLVALAEASGLILVTGSTGQGKTTAIEEVLADPRCPPSIGFLGDVRDEAQDALRAVQLARSQVVVAVLRIPRAAGAFGRLIDAVHRQALADGMRSLRQVGRDHACAGRLTPMAVAERTPDD